MHDNGEASGNLPSQFVDLMIPVRLDVGQGNAATRQEVIDLALEILRVGPVVVTVGGVPLKCGAPSLLYDS